MLLWLYTHITSDRGHIKGLLTNFKIGALCLNYPRYVRQGEQSQVEHGKSLEDVALPRQRQTSSPLLKACFCLWGCVWEDALRAEEPGTLSLAMAAQRCSEPWAALAACLGWRWQRGWHRFGKKAPQLAPLLLGHTTPLHVRVDGNVIVTLFLESRRPQKRKFSFLPFVWPCSSKS